MLLIEPTSITFLQSMAFMEAGRSEIEEDIFEKYRKGTAQGMPFQSYEREEHGTKKGKKRGSQARGHYKKYTTQERQYLVQQILAGETIRSLAEKHSIPKRNLIRWKHQYLTLLKPTSRTLPHENDIEEENWEEIRRKTEIANSTESEDGRY